LEYLQDYCLSSFITVPASKEAPKRTCDAALALQAVIKEALSDHVVEGCGGMHESHSFFHVLKRTELGPNVIEVHIGKHPSPPVGRATKSKKKIDLYKNS
jgi:hypothetical protein